MIKIETTPNLYGITLSGDYQDLNELYDSISRYLNFYQENDPCLPYHEYEYLLSLNYDIRHAYMGSRGWSLEENNAEAIGVAAECIYQLPEDFKQSVSDVRSKGKNGNLYFQVEILYPLIFHYLTTFESILFDELPSSHFQKWGRLKNKHDVMWFPYDEITAHRDRARMQLFTSLIWQNIATLLGQKDTLQLLHFMSYQDHWSAHSLYTDVLLHYQLTHFRKLTVPQKKKYLKACLYEIMGIGEINISDAADAALENAYQKSSLAIQKVLSDFPAKEQFYEDFHKAFNSKKPVYRDDFEKYLEGLYGVEEDEEGFEW